MEDLQARDFFSLVLSSYLRERVVHNLILLPQSLDFIVINSVIQWVQGLNRYFSQAPQISPTNWSEDEENEEGEEQLMIHWSNTWLAIHHILIKTSEWLIAQGKALRIQYNW